MVGGQFQRSVIARDASHTYSIVSFARNICMRWQIHWHKGLRLSKDNGRLFLSVTSPICAQQPVQPTWWFRGLDTNGERESQKETIDKGLFVKRASLSSRIGGDYGYQTAMA